MKRLKPEKVWLAVSGPTDIGSQEVERLSLDIGLADYEFMERLAAYRNMLSVVRGKKLIRKWSRKSLAESFLAAQCDAMRHQMAEMFQAVGELPDTDDVEALERFVRKVIAWDKKNTP